jgi:DNA-binding transcriptional ArsR family regulator
LLDRELGVAAADYRGGESGHLYSTESTRPGLTLKPSPNCLQRWLRCPPAADATLDRTFHALADPSRRSILVRLSRGPASVSELAEPLAMSLPAVVQHIDVLQKSGLVRSEKVGRVRTCRLEPTPMRSVEQWIAQHRATWEHRLDRLGDVLNTTHRRTE